MAVTFGLKVRDAFEIFEEVQMKIIEIEDRTALQLYNLSGFPRVLENNKFIFQVPEMSLNFSKSGNAHVMMYFNTTFL